MNCTETNNEKADNVLIPVTETTMGQISHNIDIFRSVLLSMYLRFSLSVMGFTTALFMSTSYTFPFGPFLLTKLSSDWSMVRNFISGFVLKVNRHTCLYLTKPSINLENG